MKVSTVQYLCETLSSWEQFEKKVEKCVKIAHEKGSDLLLFPEYLSLELLTLFPLSDLKSQFQKLQQFLPQFLDLFKNCAKKYQIYLCAGTFPVASGNKFRNRSFIIAPNGNFDFQDKLQFTQSERLGSVLETGDEIKLLRTSHALIGISICYDSEFPSICRKQIEAGAQLILVPSCTISEAGFYRVHISSRARAIENQCFVMTSTLIGPSIWGEEVDAAVGNCGIFCPADVGFPSSGILCQGSEKLCLDLCHTALNFEHLTAVRKGGDVLNHADWHYLPPLMNKKVIEISI